MTPPGLLVIGFKSEESLVHELGRALKSAVTLASIQLFDAGELHVVGPVKAPSHVVITTNIEADPASLWRACFLAQSARASGAEHVILISPWIAYGRQDRMAEPGEAAGGLLVGKWLSDAFDRIYTFDAHSHRFCESFCGKLQNIHGSPLLFPTLTRATLIIAPDEGAQRRAEAAAQLLGRPFFVLRKRRNSLGVEITLPSTDICWSEAIPLLVDDMTDTGSTVIAAATALKKAGAPEVLAFIPHVLRGKILRSRAEGVINRVEAVFDHETQTYAPGHLSLLAKQFLTDYSCLK